MALFVGAALVLFTALAVGSLALVASQELANYTATRHGTLGRQAATVLEQRGSAGLAQWLSNEAAIPSNVTVYVLDERGAELLGRPLPELYRSFIERSVVPSGRVDGPGYRPVRLAPQLVGTDGATYAFLVLPNRIGILGSPSTTLGVIIAALLVMALIAWLIARTFVRPIAELQTAARELANGDTAARVPAGIVARRDELGTLAGDFNSMAERIATLLETRQRLMGELSHELRSPLARLRAAVGLATHRGALDERETARIELEIARMDRLIGDLLRYSKLEAAAPLERRLLRIDDMLRELIADEEIEAAQRSIRLTLSAAGDLTVVGDPTWLRRACENVLRNAIRHSPRESAVEINAARDGGRITVLIEDHGPGVPEEALERIFEPFVRLAPASGDTNEAVDQGTGLGLAIARRVLKSHSGAIAASRRVGGGLSVALHLPAAEFA
jgi:two-component system, OmpR family, sensor kinase